MAAGSHVQRARPLLGLRRRPGRIALALMRTPRPLYRHSLGRFLGHTFLLIAHRGRRSGARHETVAMALGYDPETREVTILGWGDLASEQAVRTLVRSRPFVSFCPPQ